MGAFFKLITSEVSHDCVKTNPGLGLSVVNLSDYEMNSHESSLLKKGLGYIPYSKANKGSLMEGFRDFSRKVKLSYFFHNKPSKKCHQERLYREKSSWLPDNKFLPPELIEELDTLELKLSKIRVSDEPKNMTTQEYDALKTLSRMDDIVFKKADKGSAICIMTKTNYVNEALSQLNRDKYYQSIPGPVFQNTFADVNDILNDLKNKRFLDQAQVNYLKPDVNARERVFYTLPKIHKKQDTWLAPNEIPPGRPIVSDINSDSYRYSRYIDNVLKPLADLHPSYIKNTYDFLDQLRDQEFTSGAFLVTFDVEALYTNIQPEKGLSALQSVYERSGLHIAEFEHAKSLLEISLKNNDFCFGDKYFNQIFGTSMGKVFAPTYASIFMAEWEHTLMDKVQKQPDFYKRFLDDGFLVWQGSKTDLLEFLQTANNHDDSIKLSWEINDITIDFLDVTIFKGNRFSHHNIFDTKVFFKTTDTHELLDKRSYHPNHIFKSIVKSQLIRFRRICNNMDDFHEATSNLFKVLREKRHYSSRFLRKIKSEFLRIYHHELAQTDDPAGASLRCGRRKCECCLWIEEKSYFGDLEYSIQGKIDCNSKNIIYIIECKKCKMQYVGETRNSLKIRFQRHLSDIRTYKDTSIANHFNYDCPNDYDVADLKMYPIEYVEDQGLAHMNEKKLLQRESFWIEELKTLDPDGLNTRQSSSRPNIHVAMTYSNTANLAFRQIRQCFDNLKTRYPQAISGNLVCSFKRNKNISEYLTRAKLK